MQTKTVSLWPGRTFIMAAGGDFNVAEQMFLIKNKSFPNSGELLVTRNTNKSGYYIKWSWLYVKNISKNDEDNSWMWTSYPGFEGQKDLGQKQDEAFQANGDKL